MNHCDLTGRLTREPEVRYGGQDNQTAIARMSIAVQDNKDTDFINVKALGKLGEWTEKYLHKGMKIEAGGKIKTGSYTNKQGNKVYYTEVLASELHFAETKAEATAHGQAADTDGFMDIPDGEQEELPFN